MTQTVDTPVPYRVIYSDMVRNSLRELIARARERGLGSLILDAVKEIDRRLRLYPQFGEPLVDLSIEVGQMWVGTVQPLVVRYAIYEERRLVMVTVPILPLPGTGF